MKYIRTKDGVYKTSELTIAGISFDGEKCYRPKQGSFFHENKILKQADNIEELCDEIVLIEDGEERNIVYLQEAYDRIVEYHEQNNYEPKLIGRIKVGFDKKAVAEWKENEQDLFDWILL